MIYFAKHQNYSKEELIGKPHSIIRHPDNPKGVYETLWKTIRSGKTWSGKLKNLDKNKQSYYVNSTIIPIFDDDFTDEIVEYIGIRFLTTEEEMEKREFKKKVLQSIKDQKRKEQEYKFQIEELKNKPILNEQNVQALQQGNIDLQKKLEKKSSQILYFEDEVKTLRNKVNETTVTANKKIKSVFTLVSGLKLSNEKLTKNEQYLKDEQIKKQETIKKLQSELSVKDKKIEDLMDVINYYEKKLKAN